MAAIDSSICINSTTHHLTNRNHSSDSTFFTSPFQNQVKYRNTRLVNSPILSTKCSKFENLETHQIFLPKIMSDPHSIDQDLLQKLVYDALVWSSLHGLVVGDRNIQVSESSKIKLYCLHVYICMYMLRICAIFMFYFVNYLFD